MGKLEFPRKSGEVGSRTIRVNLEPVHELRAGGAGSRLAVAGLLCCCKQNGENPRDTNPEEFDCKGRGPQPNKTNLPW